MAKPRIKTSTEADRQLIDMQNAAMALGKSGLSVEQCVNNFTSNVRQMHLIIRMQEFAGNNKQILIEDYTRQSNI